MNKNTRAGKAGKAFGEAIIEMVHLMYQKNTALSFLHTLNDELWKEERNRASELNKEKDVKSKQG